MIFKRKKEKYYDKMFLFYFYSIHFGEIHCAGLVIIENRVEPSSQ